MSNMPTPLLLHESFVSSWQHCNMPCLYLATEFLEASTVVPAV